jgi:GNAT superfamily N-acetyltransferase
VEILDAHSLPAAAVADALARVAAGDPFTVGVDAASVLAADARVAVADGVVLGVGWRVLGPSGAHVDLRVIPESRRRGVASALLRALLVEGPAVETRSSCDAGHPRARRFMERRGFVPEGLVFFQRWDGDPADVPPAFRTDRLEDSADAEADAAFMRAASADSWPPPTMDAADFLRPDVRVRVAWLDGERAGIVAAERMGDAWQTGGFSVLPRYRKRGVGRALLAELMADAAREQVGVVLRVHQAAARIQAWTASLGFWTYRSWIYYRRPAAAPPLPALRPGTLLGG